MPYSIYTTKNARLDIKEATEWEYKRHPDLSDRFLSDLEEKIIRISNNPKHYQIRYLSVHCAPLDIFQYLIHYTIVESEQQVNHTPHTPHLKKADLLDKTSPVLDRRRNILCL